MVRNVVVPVVTALLVVGMAGACSGTRSGQGARPGSVSPPTADGPAGSTGPTGPAVSAGPAGSSGSAVSTETTSTRPPAATTTPSTGPSPLAFAATVSPVTAADLPSSWRPGCPLGPDQLRLLRLGYWGFDNQPHIGTMVVNVAVTGDVIKIFSALYKERFPIHRMEPVDAFGGSDPASMDADNTSGFNCRNAVAPGPPHWSVHAFGEAIDVNTVENPYVQGGTVTPPAGAAFVDRSVVRPGMAVAGGSLVRAFSAAGWSWGGRWTPSPDYQHFSKTGG